MRVAVTGGSGQLGTLILRRLADDPAIREVIALDVQPPLAVSAKLRDVRADVRDPRISEHLRGCDALIHLAFLVAKRGARALQDEVNVRGSANVFRAAIAAGVRRILYSSSVAAYGVFPGLPVPITEETPRTRQPGFWYASAKFDVEADLDELERAHPGLSVARFRPAILVGRRMEHQLGAAMRRGVLPDGGALPLVWDEDVAEAFLLALRSGARGPFLLAAADPLPARELARAGGLRLLRVPLGPLRALDRAIAALRILPPADPGWLGVANFPLVYSSAKALRELGWQPRCPAMRDVMRRYAETVPRRLDRRIARWVRIADAASAAQPARADLAADFAVHCELTGRDGGDLAVRIASGRVRIAQGAPRPPQASVTLPATTFRKLVAGPDAEALLRTEDVQVTGTVPAALALAHLVD